MKVPPGVTVKQVRFENVLIRDPVADGISNGGTGDINSYVVANCAEFGRTRVRSSIEFSRLPDNVVITGFIGPLIEIETNGASPTLKRVHISNSSVEILDPAAHPADGRSNRLTAGGRLSASTILYPYDASSEARRPGSGRRTRARWRLGRAADGASLRPSRG